MKPRLSSVVGRLTIVNILTSATGFVTGPMLARTLGADGRGDLAAILVPLSLAPAIFGLALPYFANRELARGRPLNLVLGSVGVPTLVVGVLAAACAFPAAALLAEGRETVRVCLVVVFLTLPITMLGSVLIGCLQGLERWGRLIGTRLVAFGVPFVAITVLFALDRLTLATAAGFTILGALLSIAPAVSLLGERGRPVVRTAVAREGLSFGLRTWVGGLAYLANARLDQLVMITAVPPRELGLYAVAATIAGASTLLTSAVTPPLLTRVAAGEVHLLAQTLRVVLVATAAINLVLAAAAPMLLHVVFGREFGDATVMTLVLLAAALPLGGGTVIGAAMQADGAPGVPSLAEGLALVVTVAGLAVLLSRLGALGAAIVSLAAYSSSFAFQLAMARRRWPTPLREYLLPSRADVRWARELSGRLPGRSAWRGRRRRSV